MLHGTDWFAPIHFTSVHELASSCTHPLIFEDSEKWHFVVIQNKKWHKGQEGKCAEWNLRVNFSLCLCQFRLPCKCLVYSKYPKMGRKMSHINRTVQMAEVKQKKNNTVISDDESCIVWGHFWPRPFSDDHPQVALHCLHAVFSVCARVNMVTPGLPCFCQVFLSAAEVQQEGGTKGKWCLSGKDNDTRLPEEGLPVC